MAASNRHHRKLIQPSTNSTTEIPFCAIQCSFTTPCPPDCILFCPSFCPPADSSPTPSPATSPYPIPPPPHHHHHQPLSLPLKLSLIFLAATFIYTLYKFYTVWYRSRPHTPPTQFAVDHPQDTHDDDDDDDDDVVDHPIWYIRTTGLQPSVINGLAVVKFSRSDVTFDGTVVEGTDCSVCLTEFEEEDMLRLLPNCKHAFHVPCIDTWLRSHTNCPLCRAGIVCDAVDARVLEPENGDLGVLSVRGGDGGEASGSSSGLKIGETDEDRD